MKRLTNKRDGLIIAVILLLAAAAVTVMALRGNEKLAVKPSPSQSPTPTSTAGSGTSPTPTAGTTPGSPTTTPTPTGPLAKPTLQKSSGNAPGSSVPTNAAMEFSCSGTPNLSCEVILTSQTGQVINLGKKTVANNGRDSYFATFEWMAKAGSWSVIAKVSDGKGGSASSDPQPLEVK